MSSLGLYLHLYWHTLFCSGCSPKIKNVGQLDGVEADCQVGELMKPDISYYCCICTVSLYSFLFTRYKNLLRWGALYGDETLPIRVVYTCWRQLAG